MGIDKFRTTIITTVALILLLSCSCYASYLDNWRWRTPLPQGNGLGSVTWGNSSFVAVGLNGAIVNSADGTTWTMRASGTTDMLFGVAWGNARYVAVGQQGAIFTSPTGATWTARDSGTSEYLYGIAYGNNTFVAVGLNGTVLTSPDGISWTARTSITANSLYGVAYGANTFVMVGQNSTIMTSPDGITWTDRPHGNINGLLSVWRGSTQFVASGGGGAVLTSPDGVTWTDHSIGNFNTLWSVAVSPGNIFVAVDGDSGNVITSINGVNWTTAHMTPHSGVTYANGKFVIVGYGGSIMTSTDGLTWARRVVATENSYRSVAWSNSTFVAVGDSGMIKTSLTGSGWTLRASNVTAPLYGVARGSALFAAVGGAGTILTSADGITWTARTSNTAEDLYGVTWGGNKFVAIGYNGVIVTSPDGIAWTSRTSGSTDMLWSVTNGGGRFVSVGLGNTILSSTDGVTWSPANIGNPEFLLGVAWGNGTYVAAGYDGKLLTSPDAAVWTDRTFAGNPMDFYEKLAYANGSFVAVGDNGTIQTSADGVTWTTISNSLTSNYLYGIAWGLNTFVAVGQYGTILQTDAYDIPVGSVSINNDGAKTATTSVTLSLAATDDAAVTAYYASNSGATPSVLSTGWTPVTAARSYSSKVAHTLSNGDGTKTVYAWYKDASGNISAAATDTILLDKTPPTGTISINAGATYAVSNSVTLTLSCTDLNGCSHMRFSTDNITYTAPEVYATSKTMTISPLNTAQSVYVKFRDTYGNWSAGISDSIILDTIRPYGSVTINNGAAYALTNSVTLTLACTDTNGCVQMKFSPDNITYSTPEPFATARSFALSEPNGSKSVYAKFKDGAGNWSAAFSDTIIYDTVKPTVGMLINSGAAYTISNGVTLNMTCTDANRCSLMKFSADGVTFTGAVAYAATQSWAIANTDGPQTVYAKVRDTAGNWSDIVSDSIILDKVPPTGSISINSGAAYTISNSVTLTLACADSNGCSQMKFSTDNITYYAPVAYATSKAWTLSTTNGAKTVYAKFKDSAGNWSRAYSDSIILDTVRPTGTLAINAGAATTITNAVTLKMTCADTYGCTQMKFSADNVTYTAPEPYAAARSWGLEAKNGTQAVYARLRDAAGNWTVTLTDTIVVALPSGAPQLSGPQKGRR